MDLCMRLDIYEGYPWKSALLCQKWHPDTYLSAIVVFLSTDESELDVGFSCVLQGEALMQRSQPQTISFLASPPV